MDYIKKFVLIEINIKFVCSLKKINFKNRLVVDINPFKK